MKFIKQASQHAQMVYEVADKANKAIPLKAGSEKFYDAIKGHYSRIYEESNELIDAIRTNDLKEILDACVDLQIVVTGLQIELENSGFDVAKAMTKVGENNLSKVGLTKEVADESVEYHNSKGSEHFADYHPASDSYSVKRKSDNKYMKPVGFKEVSLEDCLPEGVE